MRGTHEHAKGLVFLRRVLDEASKPAKERIVLDARLEVMVVMRRLIHVAGLPGRACHSARPAEWRPDPRYSGTIAVASISSRAFFSSNPATCTTAIAG